ncbi:MAG: ABC transporter ATP-binding protein/permease [Microlunatus sp.]|nr:ABC transporter ATP-binding protein/permease [Microlunatus sp.]
MARPPTPRPARAVLVVPVSNFIEGAVDISRALVAGRRVTDFLSLQRDDEGATAPAPVDGDILDADSGMTIRSGRFTVIATARQADAVALVDRLGGFEPGATWNGTPLAAVDPQLLREQLLVADNDAALFAGTLAEVIAGPHTVTDAQVRHALHIAAIDDVVHALADGLASRIDAGGSNLSGGQRQRVRLARAVMSGPTVLLAVDPTSAVDAVTEARIAERLVRARRGRTTVVTSTSALMLAEADEVHLLVGGRLVVTGSHTSLLRQEPAYAALVFRGEAPDGPMSDGKGGS